MKQGRNNNRLLKMTVIDSLTENGFKITGFCHKYSGLIAIRNQKRSCNFIDSGKLPGEKSKKPVVTFNRLRFTLT